ncbi:MAG: hypothetical protein ACK4RK_19065 [Gemmataceae bacterium]
MAKPFKSIWICQRCGGRIPHCRGVANPAQKEFFCSVRCHNKHLRMARKAIRHRHKRLTQAAT